MRFDTTGTKRVRRLVLVHVGRNVTQTLCMAQDDTSGSSNQQIFFFFDKIVVLCNIQGVVNFKNQNDFNRK